MVAVAKRQSSQQCPAIRPPRDWRNHEVYVHTEIGELDRVQCNTKSNTAKIPGAIRIVSRSIISYSCSPNMIIRIIAAVSQKASECQPGCTVIDEANYLLARRSPKRIKGTCDIRCCLPAAMSRVMEKGDLRLRFIVTTKSLSKYLVTSL